MAIDDPSSISSAGSTKKGSFLLLAAKRADMEISGNHEVDHICRPRQWNLCVKWMQHSHAQTREEIVWNVVRH
jgi:hypothetical protein